MQASIRNVISDARILERKGASSTPLLGVWDLIHIYMLRTKHLDVTCEERAMGGEVNVVLLHIFFREVCRAMGNLGLEITNIGNILVKS